MKRHRIPGLRIETWGTRIGGGWSGGFAEAEAEFGGDFAVAWEAEGAEIVEVALAAAFGHR